MNMNKILASIGKSVLAAGVIALIFGSFFLMDTQFTTVTASIGGEQVTYTISIGLILLTITLITLTILLWWWQKKRKTNG